MGILERQLGMDRYAHNKLLETFKEEYRRTGRVNTTCGRINAWYIDLRNTSGHLHQIMAQAVQRTGVKPRPTRNISWNLLWMATRQHLSYGRLSYPSKI